LILEAEVESCISVPWRLGRLFVPKRM